MYSSIILTNCPTYTVVTLKYHSCILCVFFHCYYREFSLDFNCLIRHLCTHPFPGSPQSIMGKRKAKAESEDEYYQSNYGYNNSTLASSSKNIKGKTESTTFKYEDAAGPSSLEISNYKDIKPKKQRSKKAKTSEDGSPVETRQARFRAKCPKVGYNDTFFRLKLWSSDNVRRVHVNVHLTEH